MPCIVLDQGRPLVSGETAYYYLGIALRKQGKLEEAKRAFAKATELGYKP
ncbi:tetratricopeptide repeat protein [Acidobacteriota bacterium]